jgi:hypothetical protein
VEGVLREINEVAMVQHVRAQSRPSELMLMNEYLYRPPTSSFVGFSFAAG